FRRRGEEERREDHDDPLDDAELEERGPPPRVVDDAINRSDGQRRAGPEPGGHQPRRQPPAVREPLPRRRDRGAVNDPGPDAADDAVPEEQAAKRLDGG